MAQRFTQISRAGDTVGRLSGDEFVVLCEELDDEAEATLIATRMVEAVSLPFDLGGQTVEVSVSVGIAFAGAHIAAGERLLHDADVAMYQAKRKGGARRQGIDLREQDAAEQRSTLERDLGLAVRQGELRVEYQPIVSTDDARLCGVEALVRWNHPTQGPIPALTLIGVAEQNGLITALGRWVIKKACVDRHRWASNAGDDEFEMAVNVSAHQLMAIDFVSTVADVLTETNTPPSLLTLELTESVFISDSDRARVVLESLKQLGVTLALDDFGTGYSSLAYLNEFPIDIVKIDRTFTSKMIRDKGTRAIVGKVIELAHMLHMGVVTEGVETAQEFHEAAELGSEYCQGFHFAHPMAAEALDLLLTKIEPGTTLRLPREQDEPIGKSLRVS